MTPDLIVAEALTWEGTPFHDQGRLKGVGVDCAGVILCPFRACGVINFDITGYGTPPAENLFTEPLEAYTRPIDLEARGPADILLFRIGRRWQHLGLVLDQTSFLTASPRLGAHRAPLARWETRKPKVFRAKVLHG